MEMAKPLPERIRELINLMREYDTATAQNRIPLTRNQRKKLQRIARGGYELPTELRVLIAKHFRAYLPELPKPVMPRIARTQDSLIIDELGDDAEEDGERIPDTTEAHKAKLGNLSIIRDENGRVQQYEISTDKTDYIFRRDDAEKLFVIYSATTLEGVLSHFPSYEKEEMKKILRAFGATKENVIPPHIAEEKNSDELVQYIISAKKNGAMFAYRKNAVVQLDKALKEHLKKAEEERHILEKVEELVQTIGNMSTTEVRKFITEPKPFVPTFGDNWLAISDLHFGKKDLDGDSEITKRRLLATTEFVPTNGSTLHILILGDILETPMFAGMHGEQFKKIEFFGADQIIYAVNAFEEFFNKILKVTQPQTIIDVQVVGGNHDRFGHERSDDHERTGSAIVCAMLKKIYNNTRVKINYNKEGVISTNDSNMNVIAFHGDNNINKRKPLELHHLYAKDKNKHSVILSGHFHSFKVEEHGSYTRIQLGALCSTDSHEKYSVGVTHHTSAVCFSSTKDNGVAIMKMPL